MHKKNISLLIIFITLFFLSQFLFNSELFIDTFFYTVKLWFYHLFPTIFIFFTITDILNNYQFPYYISKIIGKKFHKIYSLPPVSSYILILSMTSGFPGNSKIIKDSLEQGIINQYDATKLLTMTHFSNPLFIIYTVGLNILHNKKIGIIILFGHFISNLLIGFLFRNIYTSTQEVKKNPTKPLPFMTLLKNSIHNSFLILENVLGIILFFSFITTLINNYLHLNPFSNTILNGLLEITKGLSMLENLSLPIISKAILATFFLSFGGFSIHLQIISILNKYHPNYYIYLLSRILHAAISSLIVLFLLINC